MFRRLFFVPTIIEMTREQRRSRRKRAVRARTISIKRMTKRELELGRLLYPDVDEVERPESRFELSGVRALAPSFHANTTYFWTFQHVQARSS